MRRYIFLTGRQLPYRKGAGPKCSQFWGFPSKIDVISMGRGGVPALPNFGIFLLFMRTSFVTELPNVTCGGGACILGQPRIPSQVSGVSALTNFRVILYFFLHPLTQNDQVRLGNTMQRGMFLGGLPHHCAARVCQRGSHTDTGRIT